MKLDKDNKLDCGKYKGYTLEFVVEHDYKYVLWIYAEVKDFELPKHIYDKLFELKDKDEASYSRGSYTDDDRGSYEAEAWDYALPNHSG